LDEWVSVFYRTPCTIKSVRYIDGMLDRKRNDFDEVMCVVVVVV